MKFLISSLPIFLFTLQAYAGSCCGGGGASAQIMTGPTKAVFRTNYQNRSILADSQENEAIKARGGDQIESIETTTISGSYRLAELWQIGVSAPMVRKTRSINDEWKSAQGLGDIQLNAAYEFYPEYSRSQFITNAFAYTQLTLPTSPSLFTVERDELLEARGQGHILYTLGILAVKRSGAHTFDAQAGLTYREARSFDDTLFTEEEVSTQESWDNTVRLGYLYDINNTFMAFTNVSRDFVQNKATSVFIGESQSSLLHQTTLGLIASLDTWDVNISYQDDFLIGNSKNRILGRALSLGAIKRIDL